MSVPIPYAKSYTATAEGTIWKVVDCEHCRNIFAYQMQRFAEGEGLSVFFLDNTGAQERAQDAARLNLVRQLESDFNTVPCPQCGKYQEYMFRRIRWQRWNDRIGLGVFLLFLSLPIFGVGYLFSISSSYNHNQNIPLMMRICLGTATAICALGILLLAIRAISCWRYDPNNALEQEDRIHASVTRTVSGEALTKMLKETLAKLPNNVGP